MSDIEDEPIVVSNGISNSPSSPIDPNNEKDKYMNGSILKVTMTNFMSYSSAVINPGPRLNFVIGPNGSGKSTIVCALCLALGGDPKLLGRADFVSSYIKHGKTTGSCEIELYDDNGNNTVKCVLHANKGENGLREYTLNGKRISPKDLISFVKKYKIQVDNLCQFLPQDRVAAFVEMKEPGRLTETLKAVLGDSYVTQQREISKLQKEYANNNSNVEELRRLCDQSSKRVEVLQRDKDKFDRVKVLQEKMDLLTKKYAWQEFYVSKDGYNAAKVQVVVADKEYRDAMIGSKELSGRVNVAKQESNQHRDVVDTLRKEHKMKEKDFFVTQKKLEPLSDKLQDINNQLKNLGNQKRKFEKELQLAQKQLVMVESKLQGMVENGHGVEMDEAALNKKLSDLSPLVYNLQSKIDGFKRQHKELERNRNSLISQSRNIEGDIHNLDRSSSRKLRVLQQQQRNAYDVYNYISDHPGIFQKKVYGPIAMEVETKDNLFAKVFENACPYSLMYAFVTQCQADYNALINYTKKVKQYVRVVDVDMTRVNKEDYRFKPELGEFHSDGVTAVLADNFETPDPVRFALYIHGGLHTTVVGTDDRIVSTSLETRDLATRLHNSFERHKTNVNLFTSSSRISTKRSNYGTRELTTNVSRSMRNSVIMHIRVDYTQMAQLKASMEGFGSQIDTINGDMEGLVAQAEQIEKQKSQLESEGKQFQNYKKQIRDYVSEVRKLTRTVASKKQKVGVMERKLAEGTEGRAEKYKNELKKIVKLQVKYMSQAISTMGDLIRKKHETDVKTVESMSYATIAKNLQVQLDDILSSHKDKEKALDVAKERKKELQSRTKELKQRAVTMTGPPKVCTAHKKCNMTSKECEKVDSEIIQRMNDVLEGIRWDLGEIQAALAATKSDLSLNTVQEEKVVEWEALTQRLAVMKSQLETALATGSVLELKLNSKKQLWENDVQNLIAKLSVSFRKFMNEIECDGEVMLDKGTQEDPIRDVCEYGILIKVSFRTEMKLERLSAMTQSGGEKSVSTIMYLLAMQDMTSCPFRVVDEINQGMDSNFERKMFSRMIKSSCNGRLPQYFLITPKLIPDLEYNEAVTICIIFNGPWVEVNPQHLTTEYIVRVLLMKRERMSGRKSRIVDEGMDDDCDAAAGVEVARKKSSMVKRRRITNA